LLKNTGPRGSAAARNTGIKSATGAWILFLDADDILLPDSINRRAVFFTDNPDIVWCGGDFVQFRENQHIYNDPYFESRSRSYPFLLPAFNSTDKTVTLRSPLPYFLAMAPAITSVIMIRRSALLESNGFDESLKMQQDIHLFLRLALKYDYGFIAVSLMAYREHADNTTSSVVKTHFWRIQAFKKLLELPEFSPYQNILRTKIASLYLSNSYALRENSELRSALVCSADALRYAPFSRHAWMSLAGVLTRLIPRRRRH
jgi:glycosyltransferase involved in cell wall biosynthesis